MGQDTSLNCRSSAQKADQHQIQTTQAHAVSIMKSRDSKNEEQSDIKSKKSTTIKTQIQHYQSIPTSKLTDNKSNISLLPQHQNILKVSYSFFKGSQKVGNKYTQKGSKNLAQIVEPRYNTNMHFPKSQVAVLIESLIYSLNYLYRYQYKHHDFYTTNIHYCNGVFKINNPLLVNSSAYVLTQQRKRFSFLSPELISEILNQTSQAEIPLQVMWKSDIFSIGMIVLEFCTLQPSAQCYDEQNYQLVDKIIRERLVKVSKLYSNNIADCIAEMLRYQIQERINVEQLALLVFLNSQQEKIESQQPQQQARMSASKQVPQQLPPKSQYLPNPPHVQQQFLVLPPGQAPPPGMHLPTNHQPLALNPNSIAIPTPNYAYTRIGPNNQGLLSPTSLHNKLKVIELIHQNPLQEEQSQGVPSHLLPMHSNQVSLQPKPVYEIPNQAINMQRAQLPLQKTPTVHLTQQNLRHKYEEPTKDMFREQRQIRSPLPQPQPLRYNEPPKSYQQSQEIRPSPSTQVRSLGSNKFLNRVDQNGQTLEQRVERILQMSRNIK